MKRERGYSGYPSTAVAPLPPPVTGVEPSARHQSLRSFLQLKQVRWSLDRIGFFAYFIAITTFIAPIAYIAMAVAVVGLVTSGKALKWPLAFWLLALFIFWAAIGDSISTMPGTMAPVEDLAKVGIIFLVAYNALRDPRVLNLFLLMLIVLFALYPARGTIFNYAIYHNADFGRPAWRGAFGNANDMAAMTLLPLAVAASYVRRDVPKLVRLGALAAVVVFPIVILMTQSRAVFIGLTLFVLLVISGEKRNRGRLLFATAAVAFVAIFVAPSGVWQRLAGLKNATNTENLAEVDPEGSATQRWEIWQTSFQVIGDHPVLGVGLGRYEKANKEYSPHLGARDVHDTYLEVLAETGFPGLILFGSIVLVIILRARSVRRKASNVSRSPEWRRLQLLEFSLFGYLVAGIWGTFAFLTYLYIHLALLLVLADVVQQQSATARQHLARGAT